MSTDTKEVVLKHSIPLIVEKENGEKETKQINKLVLTRLKAKHLKLLPSDFQESEGALKATDVLKLVGGMSGLPEETIDEIDFEDLPVLTEALEEFMGKNYQESLPTGKK